MSPLDQKKLVDKILPSARSIGISEDLRGWNWNRPPLKPMYDEKIPMYLVCSKYCPTSRDVFLNRVVRATARPNEAIILGSALHRVVSSVINSFLDGRKISFESWYEAILKEKQVAEAISSVRERSRIVWDYVLKNCEIQYMNRSSEQPYATKRDLLATSVPFLVEHKISGELLGLSGLLSVDCYDYLRGIVFDLKVAHEEKDWYRLAPTGYAIVLESVYEVPVDAGCVVYLWFQGDELRTSKDLFFINDDLRSWWLEERDNKISIVGEKRDPGISSKCYEDCIYWGVCRGEVVSNSKCE
ncbi:MAG: type I-A CRISPR-associated protein Cas4/Csa1 [Candidatus Methanosuratincola petrocarbonis]|nr:type I-A CRISPR-associated protein Cas4/Csa1 [Candidatus Methanosuratincola sp.]